MTADTPCVPDLAAVIDSLLDDPDGVLSEILDEIRAENGEAWWRENERFVLEETRYARQLFGI